MQMMPAQVKKVLFCSGKIYFDLAERSKKKIGKILPSSGWNKCILCR